MKLGCLAEKGWIGCCGNRILDGSILFGRILDWAVERLRVCSAMFKGEREGNIKNGDAPEMLGKDICDFDED